MKAPKNNVFYRNNNWSYPKISHGEGIFLYGDDGREYIDGCSGSAVANIGHGNQEVADIASEQIKKMAFTHLSRFTTDAIEGCAQRVADLTPGDLNHVYFVSGGSEATETAWKLARQYFVERDGNSSKSRIITRWNSFHGNTMGSLSMTGVKERRAYYEPLLNPVHKINQAYCYRCPYGANPDSCQLECAYELEDAIKLIGAENVMAFVAEPIIGAAAPAVKPPRNYFKLIAKICKENDVLLIVDEVMMGFGRTGKNFGIDHFDITPDIISIAKGMSCGYSPIGAAVANDLIFSQIMEQGSGQFVHGHTYGGNPLSAAIANKVIDIMQRDECTINAEKIGKYLLNKFQELECLSYVGDVRGVGLIFGLEFVVNKKDKTPFDRSKNIKGRVMQSCLQEGLVVYPGGGTGDGVNGDHILIAPPLNITKTEADELFIRLKKGLELVDSQL